MIVGDLAALATPVDRLSLLTGNPRRGDVDAVARSLSTFGQRKPIVARRDGTVIAGNHTLQAARKLGWPEIAVVWVEDDDATAKAFALADNRTAELGSYDDEALAALIAEVQEADAELLAATGWDGTDLADLMSKLEQQVTELLPVEVDDEVPAPPKIAKTVQGDVWLLGPHRILCGDCRVPTDVDRLLAGARINLAFTSPPYAQQREYDASSGFKPIPPGEYVEWFRPVADNVRANLADDGSWFVNIKEHSEDGQRSLYVRDLVLAHVRLWAWRFVDELIWHKDAIPGTWPNRFKNAWEPIFHFSVQAAIKFRPEHVLVESSQAFAYDARNGSSSAGGNRGVTPAAGTGPGLARPSNVIRVSTRHNPDGLAHEAAFPVPLPQWFVKAYTDSGDVVFDPFMGSGSTLLAAHAEGRVAYGTELSPTYVDVICARWQKATGIMPIAESTGRPHDFLEADSGKGEAKPSKRRQA
jgi:DNA modification methylase